jgi:hypothetical protein
MATTTIHNCVLMAVGGFWKVGKNERDLCDGQELLTSHILDFIVLQAVNLKIAEITGSKLALLGHSNIEIR